MLLVFLQNGRLVRKNLTDAEICDIMMTVLFILSIAVFAYLLYALIKPEKF